jgi:hypothetical protein
MPHKPPKHSPEIQLALDKEQERYFKALEKLHKEQEATSGMMLDDRELDLTSEHYQNIGKILGKQNESKDEDN